MAPPIHVLWRSGGSADAHGSGAVSATTFALCVVWVEEKASVAEGGRKRRGEEMMGTRRWRRAASEAVVGEGGAAKLVDAPAWGRERKEGRGRRKGK